MPIGLTPLNSTAVLITKSDGGIPQVVVFHGQKEIGWFDASLVIAPAYSLGSCTRLSDRLIITRHYNIVNSHFADILYLKGGAEGTQTLNQSFIGQLLSVKLVGTFATTILVGAVKQRMKYRGGI